MKNNEQEKRDQLIARIKQVMGCELMYGSGVRPFPVHIYRVPANGVVDSDIHRLVTANNYQELEFFYLNIRGMMKAPTP